MKIIFFAALFLFLNVIFISADSADIIKKADELDFFGRHKEALELLLNASKDASPDLKVVYRIALQAFELSNLTDSKKEKIKFFEMGADATRPFIDINYGAPRDRADIIHWYMVSYASKIKLLGIFGGRESLTIVPEIFKTMNKCLKIDPAYAGAYFFMGKLYNEVPAFLGGSKVKVGGSLLKALEYSSDKERILMLYNAALCFIDRNWSADKKKKEFFKAKLDKGDGTPLELSDKEYAYNLLSELKKKYDASEMHSVRDQKCYKDALEIMKKIKP